MRREHSGRGGDRGTAQSGWLEGVAPRVLDPYTPPGQNPFWSEGVRNASFGRGDTGGKGGGAYAEPTEMDIEKIKATCMRDAEEAFSKELRRLGVVVEGESESYHTASSRKEASRGEGQRGAVPGGSGGVPGGVDGGRRDPDPPPGLNHGKISFDGAGGPTVSESLRHLELPSLPQVGSEGAALQFGDWLTKATPLMSDLGASSKNWWERSLMVAEDFYGRWLESTPLERLRLKPAVEIDPGYTRLEQRGISMLLRYSSRSSST